MTKAIRIHEFGGPEVLRWENVEVGDPGPGEVRLRQTAIGLNYNEVNTRMGKGSFPPEDLPIILGREAAGVIEAVGPGATEFATGQRVAYGIGGFGGYAEARLIPADKLVALPDAIEEQTATAIMVKGMTARYLLLRAHKVKAGDSIVIHAAAGGVGSILCQWAKHLGATVIGTVGSETKAEIARSLGCDHTVIYTRENLAERVREITDGQGVGVVYDSVGKDTLEASLDSLELCGQPGCVRRHFRRGGVDFASRFDEQGVIELHPNFAAAFHRHPHRS